MPALSVQNEIEAASTSLRPALQEEMVQYDNFTEKKPFPRDRLEIIREKRGIGKQFETPKALSKNLSKSSLAKVEARVNSIRKTKVIDEDLINRKNLAEK